ncbi:OmpA family protein [Aliivibrio fischeri]|uniref:OmpA family protein n=1 Tax=Aliivibrio fischeri TaxID=668 RepID=UPI0012D9BCAF|nr:OmpA family protein [Aliivibrio fischeri]MUK62768.1 OmpA family protein [Aliivibrio fischeri]MUL22332.1 OmpA family protein [Aliivibrio fischeri]MUL26123.1 OmpA family protein [Aliivibrio fischeri]
MKKQLLGIIISASLLMGCQSTSDDEMADIAETPTVASFVDYHNEQLQQFVTEDIGSVAQTNEEIIILLNGDKSFDSGSTEIKNESKLVLSQLAKLLNDKPESEVFIAGHTDSRGSKKFNMSLSNKRADSVLALLEENGVDGNRINTYGFGESEPIATNINAEGRKKNRRIEIRITPISELFEKE